MDSVWSVRETQNANAVGATRWLRGVGAWWRGAAQAAAIPLRRQGNECMPTQRTGAISDRRAQRVLAQRPLGECSFGEERCVETELEHVVHSVHLGHEAAKETEL